MRMILLAASAMTLACCAMPQMQAANANMGPQQAASASEYEAAPPPQLRRPPSRGWAGYGYRSMPR
jgi:hypothetical protein